MFFLSNNSPLPSALVKHLSTSNGNYECHRCGQPISRPIGCIGKLFFGHLICRVGARHNQQDEDQGEHKSGLKFICDNGRWKASDGRVKPCKDGERYRNTGSIPDCGGVKGINANHEAVYVGYGCHLRYPVEQQVRMT